MVIEKRKRGLFGKLIAALFWGWHLLMGFWLFSALGTTSTHYATATSEAARAGTTIGATIGISFVLMVWTFGAVILGTLMLFTRGKKILITQHCG